MMLFEAIRSLGHWALARPFSHTYGLVLTIHCVVCLNLGAAVVTNCNETSLRAAMTRGGIVMFTCDGTIFLSNTIVITTTAVLDGQGHSIVLSGNNLVRVFEVLSNATLTILNLTIAN